jgi:hypothetical protein
MILLKYTSRILRFFNGQALSKKLIKNNALKPMVALERNSGFKYARD